jgi:hypothetical protein
MALVGDDLGLDIGGRVVEVQGAETLFGRRLQILDQALVAGVVRDDDLEIGVCLDQLALLLERQLTAMVGERMDDQGCILAGLHDLVEIADGADAGCDPQRAVS